MKPRRNLYGIHNDFSAVAGGLRRGCILIRNRDGGCDNIHCTEHMCDATQLTWLGLLGGWGDDNVHGTCKHGRCYGGG